MAQDLPDVSQVELTKNRRIIGVASVHSTAEVTNETARVVAQAAIRTRWRTTLNAAHGAKIDRHIGKGTCLDVSTTCTGGQRNGVARDPLGRDNDRPIVRDVLAVASETVIIAIEQRRVFRGVSVFGPVPVRLIALVATLLSKSLLIDVKEPPVPRREDAVVVYAQGLLDMGDGEIVELRHIYVNENVYKRPPNVCVGVSGLVWAKVTYSRLCTPCNTLWSARGQLL